MYKCFILFCFVHRQQQNYRFSSEELRVIAECESEAFRYRSLPFSFGLGTATLLAVKNGVLKVRKRKKMNFAK